MGIKSYVLQTRSIGKAIFLRSKIFFQPQNRALSRGSAQSQGDGEACCGSCIANLIGKNFMHCTVRQTIMKDAIDGFITDVKGGALRHSRILLSKRRNVASQRRKIDGCHYGSLSMFMICSIMESDSGESQVECERCLSGRYA